MQTGEHDVLKWVEGCKQSDRKSQEALYRHFYPLFMPVCMSYIENNDDAIDIYNRAFLKIFKSLNSFEQRGVFGAWARRIVVNTAIDFLRRNKKMKWYTPIEEANEVYVEESVIQEMTSNEILDLFRYLPPSQRMVMNLFVVEGKSHAEIGEELGISTGTSKWHLNQARKKIQEKIFETGILTK
jgi:RNA polymerase sigma factor (sigma-70 family)